MKICAVKLLILYKQQWWKYVLSWFDDENQCLSSIGILILIIRSKSIIYISQEKFTSFHKNQKEMRKHPKSVSSGYIVNSYWFTDYRETMLAVLIYHLDSYN